MKRSTKNVIAFPGNSRPAVQVAEAATVVILPVIRIERLLDCLTRAERAELDYLLRDSS